jgi:hypothetical protein
MPRRSRTTEELQKAAVAINYEIEMLVFSAEHLGGWHSSPMTSPVGNENHMALESFLLHFRNLRAFLCPSIQRQSDDDVLASDYLGMLDASDIGDLQKLSADKERLDKMLAHVSYSRADYIEAGNYRWDTSSMLLLIVSELKDFFARLPALQRDWFACADELKRL